MKTNVHRRRRLQYARCAVLLIWTLSIFLLGFLLGGLDTPQACEAVEENTDTALTVQLEDELQVLGYTEEDLELLALVIYQEAGSDACSDDTRLKIGEVVMNRVADCRFPDSVREVVLQRAQYGRLYWTGPVWPERANKEEEVHAVVRAYDCAKKVLNGYRSLPTDTVFQAEFEQGDETVAHQDGIYFCRWEVKP